MKYLYVRKRVAGKLTSTYVDVYSDELYQLLLRNAREQKDLNKAVRKINKELISRGYEDRELSTRGESAYKCAGINDGFSASDNTLFTSCGRFFANKDEAVFIEIPCMEDTEYRLCILSGKIKKQNNGDLLKLTSGLNRIIFEMSQDGSFEFQDTVSGEAVYADTINTKHFI